MTHKKIWTCKIGEVDRADLPIGLDSPMRNAVAAAYKDITGTDPDFVFSGWDGSLDESERAAHENRMPSESYGESWKILRVVATELKRREGESRAAGQMLEGLLGITDIPLTGD